eukprot:c24641_g1_i1 orf=122-1051(-)
MSQPARAPSTLAASAEAAASDDTPKAVRSDTPIDVARTKMSDVLDSKRNLIPHFLRLAFYDAISYDAITKVNGPNGSIRKCKGLDDLDLGSAIATLEKERANAGDVWSNFSYADLYQLAGIVAVKKLNGPDIKFQHGRMDSYLPTPLDKLPKISEDQDATSVRSIFHRAGFNDKEIVVLSSAFSYMMTPSQPAPQQPQHNVDNSYHNTLWNLHKSSSTTSSTPTVRYWKCLLSDNSFRFHVEQFAQMNKEDFNKEYAAAHQKLSELGFMQFPEPVLDIDYHDMRHGIAFAVAMTILVGFMGFFYEAMRA